jgi:hypothetical protein
MVMRCLKIGWPSGRAGSSPAPGTSEGRAGKTARASWATTNVGGLRGGTALQPALQPEGTQSGGAGPPELSLLPLPQLVADARSAVTREATLPTAWYPVVTCTTFRNAIHSASRESRRGPERTTRVTHASRRAGRLALARPWHERKANVVIRCALPRGLQRGSQRSRTTRRRGNVGDDHQQRAALDRRPPRRLAARGLPAQPPRRLQRRSRRLRPHWSCDDRIRYAQRRRSPPPRARETRVCLCCRDSFSAASARAVCVFGAAHPVPFQRRSSGSGSCSCSVRSLSVRTVCVRSPSAVAFSAVVNGPVGGRRLPRKRSKRVRTCFTEGAYSGCSRSNSVHRSKVSGCVCAVTALPPERVVTRCAIAKPTAASPGSRACNLSTHETRWNLSRGRSA